VARNIAENLARLGAPVGLLAAVGDDGAGRALLAQAQAAGIDTSAALTVGGAGTGTYTAVLDHDGEMAVALADMAICDALTPDVLAAREEQLRGAALVVADLNLPRDTVAALAGWETRAHALRSRDAGVRVGKECPPYDLVLVAVSEPKMANLPQDLRGVRLLLLNEGELAARVGRTLDTDADLADACREVQAQGAQDVIVTRGARGVAWTTCGGIEQLAAAPAHVAEVTGAGDAFAAAVCWSLYQDCDDLALACSRGLHLAALTLGCAQTVCPDLRPGMLDHIPHSTNQD
jgi:pseudouridine kinase